MWSNFLLIFVFKTHKVHIVEETAERANNNDCERANPACICLWGESLFTHTKQKINSNIPGLIILKQIQPRTYGLEGFCICGLFSHHSFYLTLVENMIEQSRVIFSWPMICLKRPLLFLRVLFYNGALELRLRKEEHIQPQSALYVSSILWFIFHLSFYRKPGCEINTRQAQNKKVKLVLKHHKYNTIPFKQMF